MGWFAHSGSGPGKGDWQGLKAHLLGAAVRAAEMGRPLGLERAAYMAGLFHDLGKYDPEFQRRLEGADIRVEHSNAGARILRDITSGDDKAMAQIIGYAILGHHAGLPDRRNETDGSFDVRIERPLKIDPVWNEEIGADVSELVPRMMRDLPKDRAVRAFAVSFMGRMLFSCLVDADYFDTEQVLRLARQGSARQGDGRRWAFSSTGSPAASTRASPASARPRVASTGCAPTSLPCAAGRAGKARPVHPDGADRRRQDARLARLRPRPCPPARPFAHHLRHPLHRSADRNQTSSTRRCPKAVASLAGARIETPRGLFVEDRAARRKAPQAEGTGSQARGFLTSAPPAVGEGDPARRRE